MTHSFRTIRAVARFIGFALAIGCSAGDTQTPSDRDQTEVPDLATRRLVPASDVIVGRTVSDEHVFVLTDMQRLITIDPFRQTAERRQLSGVAIEDTVWGLARLDSGTMWTLIGTGALGEISPEGRIVQQIPLREPQIGLFGWKNRLIYQAFESVADTPVLMQGPPGSDTLEPFGSLHVRHFDTTRVEMVALNFVVCGVGRGDELPCWFWSEATIDRVRVGETSRPLRFKTLSISEPTVGLGSPGMETIRSTRQGPGLRSFRLPEAGGWWLSLICHDQEEALSPSFVPIPSDAEETSIRVRVGSASAPRPQP